ncbi:MAG TPA: DUF92 domain-containing protein [Anaerolineales bacterium]|nr:DUF92 domain-containing protein [Anaerolineales bacterium]
MLQLLLGLLFAAVIALVAYRASSLSRSGAWGAFLEGTIIFGLGGWQWATLLLAFFISSSALTRLFARRKASLNEKFDKGGTRDIGQVLANGGIAAIFTGLHFFFPQAAWTWMGFAASLAAVNADTWATELGVLNPSMPRLITTWKPVERGTSGGISLYGTLASLAGSAFVSILGALVAPGFVQVSFPILFLVLTLSGLLGSLFDSFLGATVQAIYFCPKCEKETEKHPSHTCGTETVQLRGWKWLNNDLVNLCCSVVGALVGVVL